MAALAVDRRHGREIVEVDGDDGGDGVDQRHGIRPALVRGARGIADVGDVGGELHDHRHARILLAPAGDHLDVFRHLAHGGAHAALAHAMRAAEVELDAVAARLLDARQDGLPAFLRTRNHDGDDHGAVRPFALHLLDLLEVHLQRPVGDELDVVEAEEPAVSAVDRAIARAVDVDDGRAFLAQRLPDDATPARLEGAHHVVFLVGRRRRGQPERVGRLDADEVRAKVSHGASPYAAEELVNGFGRAAAVVDGGNGQVLAARHAVAAGPDAGNAGALVGCRP